MNRLFGYTADRSLPTAREWRASRRCRLPGGVYIQDGRTACSCARRRRLDPAGRPRGGGGLSLGRDFSAVLDDALVRVIGKRAPRNRLDLAAGTRSCNGSPARRRPGWRSGARHGNGFGLGAQRARRDADARRRADHLHRATSRARRAGDSLASAAPGSRVASQASAWCSRMVPGRRAPSNCCCERRRTS